MSEPDAVVSPSPVKPSRRYYGLALILVVVGLAFSLVAMFGDSHTGPTGESEFGTVGTLGGMIYLVVYGSLVALNWHGFVRAIAAHRWLGSERNAGYGCIVAFAYFFVVFPIVIPFYPLFGAFQYARGYLDQRKLYPLEHRKRVAELEAQLGIEPQVEGQCPNCGRPLQVDAVFCSFCGARVIPEVRVCPKCGTVSLPGAEWCAKCGTALDRPRPVS